MFEDSLEVLDHVRLHFSPAGILALNIALAFIMFGIALDIHVSDFRKIVTRPKSTLTGITSQFLLLPALTYLLVLFLRPTPTVALGMILVASCPGGNISNFISSLAKGNTTLSIGLSAIATLAATFMTPLNFAFWGSLYTHFYNRHDAEALLRPLHIDSGQMFQTVFILLGIPLVLGLIFARRFPRLTVKIRGPIRKLSVGIFIAFVVIALAKNFEFFIQFIHLIFIIVLIHNALALVTGYSASSLMRLPQTDRRTIAIETGIQNSGLGLALIFNPKIFPPDMELGGMAIIAAWWGIWHIVSGLSLSWFWSRKPVTDETETEQVMNVHHHSQVEGK